MWIAAAVLLRLRRATSRSATRSSSTSTAWCSTSRRCGSGARALRAGRADLHGDASAAGSRAADGSRVRGKPVEIGDDVWIGGGAIVCPGVRIGARSVIGAGSVVTRDVPDDVFAAGNPCRVVRALESLRHVRSLRHPRRSGARAVLDAGSPTLESVPAKLQRRADHRRARRPPRVDDGAYELSAARWGLIPHWWTKATLPSLTFNARSEEVAVKPMWRDSYRHMRCLMPALGLVRVAGACTGVGSRVSADRPSNLYYVHCDTSPVIAFAGLMASVARSGRPMGRLVCAAFQGRGAELVAHSRPHAGRAHPRRPMRRGSHRSRGSRKSGGSSSARAGRLHGHPVSASATVPDSLVQS